MPDPLADLAARAARACREPFFLGFLLAVYQERYRLDDAALAALLGCDPAALVRLRLCRSPRAGEPKRTADLAAVARRYGINWGALLAVVSEPAPPRPPRSYRPR
jgi:hypothetical protein